MNRTAFRMLCSAMALGVTIGLFAPQSALAGPGSWSEDWNGDGATDHVFSDRDGDHNPEAASVFTNDGSRIVSEWEDTDDDGDWDRRRIDRDGNGRFEGDDEAWGDVDSNEPQGPRPQTETPNVMGDMNGDQQVNNFDIDYFLLAITAPDQYRQYFPNFDILSGDTNFDLSVDNFDIDGFVLLLTQP